MKARSSKKHSKRGYHELEPVLVEASVGQLSYMESLIENSLLSNHAKEKIYEKMQGFVSEGEAEESIGYLLNNQIDPIDSGFNYGQTDIIRKLKKLR